jgi:hypothetical protein
VAAFVSVGAEHARERTALQQRTQSRNIWLTPAVLLENKFDDAVGTKSRKHWELQRRRIAAAQAAVAADAQSPSLHPSPPRATKAARKNTSSSSPPPSTEAASEQSSDAPSSPPRPLSSRTCTLCLQNKWNNHFQEGKSSN